MNYYGYLRNSKFGGTRNHIAIMSTVVCANEVALAVHQAVKPSTLLVHPQGCCQTPPDVARVANTLIGLGINSNVGAVLLISLGCESVNPHDIYAAIAQTGKPVELIPIQHLGGSEIAIQKGIEMAEKMLDELQSERQEMDLSGLVVGLKCGCSDTLSGIVSNPTVGRCVDMLLDNGASVVFGEVTELLGAEHILAKRFSNEKICHRMLEATREIEEEAMKMGVDVREGQPTRGNIAGGLTTLEEKSLGAIAKSGSRKITGFLEYGQQVDRPGLYLMDSPGREPELLTGLAAAGAQVIIFTTGMGAPQGHPIVPVIKVTANTRNNLYLQNHVDMFFTFYQESRGFDTGAHQLLEFLIKVCSGQMTRAEEHDYAKYINIYVKGPVL